MKLNLTIDMRERDMMTCCHTIMGSHPLKDSVHIVSSVLPIGDIIISNANTNEDLVIIERKTLADLSASIKDGRYTEQSYRLNGIPHPNHNIIYLIEGDITRQSIFKSKIDKQMLYSAIFSINYFKGFSVMRSSSLEESATIICNMVIKLLKSNNKLPYYTTQPTTVPVLPVSDSNAVDDAKEYCSVVKRVKKENITKDNIGEIMLCQIPGISDVSARAIFQKFKTITDLILSIKEDVHCMDDIKTIMSNGKTRKINKTVIKSIITLLL
jgi:ERCC4-type nuclease